MNVSVTQLKEAFGDALDASGTSANTIAIAAAGLAAAAFVIAFAQTVLEYASSSKARDKCAVGAIDATAKQVKLGWSWRRWRLKVHYPMLHLSTDEVLTCAVVAARHQIYSDESTVERIREAHGWDWWAVKETDDITSRHVADSFTTLMKGNTMVTTKDLNWTEMITFRLWRFRHLTPSFIRPRASWAQLLLAFGIRDTTPLKYKYADADLIPSSFDAPVQRINLHDLGCLALILGFESVEIKPRKRYFEAIGPHATITTLTLPDFGKVLRFEGDIYAIQQEFLRGSPDVLLQSCGTIRASLQFGPGFRVGGFMYPLRLLKRAVMEAWPPKRFQEELKHAHILAYRDTSFSNGQIGAEAMIFRDLSKAAPTILVFYVDKRKGGRSFIGRSPKAEFEPNIYRFQYGPICPPLRFEKLSTAELRLYLPPLVSATLTLLGAIITGFPSKCLVEPFLPWIDDLAKALVTRAPTYVKVSQELLWDFRSGALRFVRPRSTYCLTEDYIGLVNPNNYGGTMHGGFAGWIFQEIKEVYQSCGVTIQEQILPKDEEGSFSGMVNVVLFPDVLALLGNYQPNEWAKHNERFAAPAFTRHRAVNMLWAQVLLIDVSIHFLIWDDWRLERNESYHPWTKTTCAVYSGVIDSWSPTPSQENIVPPSVPSSDLARDEPEMKPTEDANGSIELARMGTSFKRTGVDQADHAPHYETNTHDEDEKEPERHSIPNGDRRRTSWNLAESLMKQADLVLDPDPIKQREKIQQLADMLELRAILLLAFYMLNPDSSDVYLAEAYGVEMPIM